MNYPLIIGFFLCIILLLIVLIVKSARRSLDLTLHQKLDAIKEEFTKNVVQTQNGFIATQQGIAQHLSQLYKEIGTINQESSQILTLTKSFYDALKPTKRRSILGEVILENIVKDVIPQEAVIPQYTFRNGRRVDILLKLPQGNVPIDAKFSLDTFKNYNDASEAEKQKYKRLCVDSIKKRVDETASYILTDEGTLDFSFPGTGNKYADVCGRKAFRNP